MKLTAIVGSATPPGRLRRAVDEALTRAVDANADALDTQLIDLAEVTVANADGRPADQLGDDTADVLAAIAGADAVVFATPVYRGSMTGVLKNLLDHVPIDALVGKPVGIVAMGASDHHYLGAERHLRDVLSFFGALTAPVAIYLNADDFADGVPVAGAAEELDALIAELSELAARPRGRELGPKPLAGGRRR
jgi:FMN reductase